MADGSIAGWWGEHRIADGQRGRFTLGPLWLEIANVSLEWWVTSRSGEISEELGTTACVPCDPADPPAGATTVRYGVGDLGDSVFLTPQLADGPVVARPDAPYVVAPGGRVEVHVSHPLWVRIEVGQSHTRLTELPARAIRRTWFGSPTDGHLCYALHTGLRQDVAELPVAAYRAITRVTVHNDASTPLGIERLRLPAPALSLYEAGGRLWTNALALRRKSDEAAEVAVAEGAPVAGATLVSGPRVKVSHSFVEHVFNAFMR